jgi:predicted nucleic acid-binding protein
MVLDTSVAVAWYLPEVFSGRAKAWQRDMLDGKVRFTVPSLHYWEVANVLRTYVRRDEIEAGLAKEIYDLHLDAPLAVSEPDRSQVLEEALRFGATAYDAVFICLSLLLDVPLLTAEKTTTPWVVKLGDRVVPVRSD